MLRGCTVAGVWATGEADRAASGFSIAARVPMYRDGEPAAAGLSRGTDKLAHAYRKVGTDIVLVLGDRLEMLAAASAALAERIPIAHVHGGESAPGIWDEQIRHAITKMAHMHFCATPGRQAKDRANGRAAGSRAFDGRAGAGSRGEGARWHRDFSADAGFDLRWMRTCRYPCWCFIHPARMTSSKQPACVVGHSRFEKGISG